MAPILSRCCEDLGLTVANADYSERLALGVRASQSLESGCQLRIKGLQTRGFPEGRMTDRHA